MKEKLIGFGIMVVLFLLIFNGLSWLVNTYLPVQNIFLVFIWSATILGLSFAFSLLTSNIILQFLKSKGTI